MKLEWTRIAKSATYGLVLSALMSFGAIVQEFVSRLIFSDSTSIYDLANPTGIVQPVTFLEWLGSFYYFPFIPLGIAICYVGFASDFSRSIMLRLSVGTFIALTGVDAWISVVDKAFPLAELLSCILYNALGAPLLAAIVIVFAIAVDWLVKRLRIANIVLCEILPLVFSVALLFVFYTAMRNLAWVTTSDISFRTQSSINGSYSSSSTEKERFGLFLDMDVPSQSVGWTGISKGLKLGGASELKSGTLDIFIFDGCVGDQGGSISTGLKTRPNYSVPFERAFGLAVSDGLSEFKVMQESGASSITSEDDDFNQFSVTPSEGKYNLTMFLSGDKKLLHKGWDKEVLYRLDMYMMDKKGEEAVLQDRWLGIATEKAAKAISFDAATSAPMPQQMQCRRVSYSESTALGIAVKMLVATVVARVRVNGEPSNPLHTNSITQVAGLNGWLTAKGVAASEFTKYISDGHVDTILLNGMFDDIYVNGVKQELKARNSVQATEAAIYLKSEDGRLVGEGSSGAVFINGRRASLTRWERIDPSVRLLLLGALGTLSLWELLKFLWRAIAQDSNVFRRAESEAKKEDGTMDSQL